MSDAVPIKVHADYCRDVDTKNLQGRNMRGNTSDSIYTTSMGGKVPVRSLLRDSYECPGCLYCPVCLSYYAS